MFIRNEKVVTPTGNSRIRYDNEEDRGENRVRAKLCNRGCLDIYLFLLEVLSGIFARLQFIRYGSVWKYFSEHFSHGFVRISGSGDFFK